MKKYRLTKDLPFAKAGTSIEFERKEGYFPAMLMKSTTPNNIWITFEGSLVSWNKLHTEGWIEEAKPREFWIRADHITTEGEIENRYWDKSRFIRVREVIE